MAQPPRIDSRRSRQVGPRKAPDKPEHMREVTGIGPKRAERIIAGWAEQRVIREIMLFLHSNGVGTFIAGAAAGALGFGLEKCKIADSRVRRA